MVRYKNLRAVVRCWLNTTGSVLPGLLNTPGLLRWDGSPGSWLSCWALPPAWGVTWQPLPPTEQHRIQNLRIGRFGLLPSVLTWCWSSPLTSPVSSTSLNKEQRHLLYLPREGSVTLEWGQLWNMDPCISLDQAENLGGYERAGGGNLRSCLRAGVQEGRPGGSVG